MKLVSKDSALRAGLLAVVFFSMADIKACHAADSKGHPSACNSGPSSQECRDYAQFKACVVASAIHVGTDEAIANAVKVCGKAYNQPADVIEEWLP